MTHDLWTDADKDRPDAICDLNGDVVLACCKVCGRGEIELDLMPDCPGHTERRTQFMTLAEFHAEYGI